MKYYVYILYSEKLNRFYTGFTSNIDQRLTLHHNAGADKYTYNADDWQLKLTIECSDKEQALNIEKHIKAMKSKTYIQNLLQYPEMSEKLKAKSIL